MTRAAAVPKKRTLEKSPRRKSAGTVEVESQSTSPARESGVQVLARAGELLRLLKHSPGGVTQVELANRLGLARTTVHRILHALVAEGLVQQSGRSGRYRLGPEILQMAEAARGVLVTEVHPYLLRLSQELNETVDLSILDRGQVTFIDQVVATHRLRAVSAIGSSFPLHCTANGKAILASMPAADVARALPETLQAFTPNTITSHGKLQAQIKEIAETGIAYDMEEHGLGICAIGGALRGTQLGFAAISIPVPSHRFDAVRAVAEASLLHTIAQIEETLSA